MKRSTLVLASLLLTALLSPAYVNAVNMPSFTRLADNTPVKLAQLQGTHALIAFWRSDCAPCIEEQPILNTIAKTYPNMRIVLISVDDFTMKNQIAMPDSTHMEIWSTKGDPEETLHTMGDSRAALPFSLFLRADGSTCAKHYGLLGTDTVDAWIKQC